MAAPSSKLLDSAIPHQQDWDWAMGSTGLSLPLLRVLRGEKGTNASVTSPQLRRGTPHSKMCDSLWFTLFFFSLSLPTGLYKSIGDSLLSRRQVL